LLGIAGHSYQLTAGCLPALSGFEHGFAKLNGPLVLWRPVMVKTLENSSLPFGAPNAPVQFLRRRRGLEGYGLQPVRKGSRIGRALAPEGMGCQKERLAQRFLGIRFRRSDRSRLPEPCAFRTRKRSYWHAPGHHHLKQPAIEPAPGGLDHEVHRSIQAGSPQA